MSLLEILEFPDPRLRKKAKPVTKFDEALKEIAENMLETMYDAHGIGLAATQVDIQSAIIVLDVSDEQDSPMVIINPQITEFSKENKEYEEGCLSVPGFKEAVSRPDTIHLKAQDLEGKAFEMDCDELLAVCVQHEMDHLDGKLFVDYITSLKRNRIKKKLEKTQKLGAV